MWTMVGDGRSVLASIDFGAFATQSDIFRPGTHPGRQMIPYLVTPLSDVSSKRIPAGDDR